MATTGRLSTAMMNAYIERSSLLQLFKNNAVAETSPFLECDFSIRFELENYSNLDPVLQQRAVTSGFGTTGFSLSIDNFLLSSFKIGVSTLSWSYGLGVNNLPIPSYSMEALTLEYYVNSKLDAKYSGAGSFDKNPIHFLYDSQFTGMGEREISNSYLRQAFSRLYGTSQSSSGLLAIPSKVPSATLHVYLDHISITPNLSDVTIVALTKGTTSFPYTSIATPVLLASYHKCRVGTPKPSLNYSGTGPMLWSVPIVYKDVTYTTYYEGVG